MGKEAIYRVRKKMNFLKKLDGQGYWELIELSRLQYDRGRDLGISQGVDKFPTFTVRSRQRLL